MRHPLYPRLVTKLEGKVLYLYCGFMKEDTKLCHSSSFLSGSSSMMTWSWDGLCFLKNESLSFPQNNWVSPFCIVPFSRLFSMMHDVLLCLISTLLCTMLDHSDGEWHMIWWSVDAIDMEVWKYVTSLLFINRMSFALHKPCTALVDMSEWLIIKVQSYRPLWRKYSVVNLFLLSEKENDIKIIAPRSKLLTDTNVNQDTMQPLWLFKSVLRDPTNT
jgi:hypothetical protein